MTNRKIDIIQRILYILALAIAGTGIFFNPSSSFLQQSSIGLSYWILDIVVILPLVYQLVFNNKIGWIIIIGLTIIHFVWTIFNLYSNNEPSILICTIIVYLIFAGGLLFILKPRQKEN